MNMLAPGDLQPFKLRIDDYLLLDRAGVFETCRVELIEGVIVAVNAEMLPHNRLKNELMFRLRLALREQGSPFDAYVEPTLSLPPFNMPEPDVMVARHDPAQDYFGIRDVAIVIEVGASSLRTDLGSKRDMYAHQGIPEYWVVAVDAREVHLFWAADDGTYLEQRTMPLAGPIASATVPDLTIDGRGIL